MMKLPEETEKVERYVLINGNILTMDSLDRRAQAIAVENGRIIRVGSHTDMSAFQDWQHYDLEGKTLLPGFIDCHSHLDFTGIMQVSLYGGDLKSIDGIINKIIEVAKITPYGQVITMFGVKEVDMKEGRSPNRYDLDQATINHPVVIVNYTGHQTYINSHAIQYFDVKTTMHGVDAQDGEITGVLRDPISVDFFVKAIARVPEDEILKGVIKAAYLALYNGVTTIHTMQGGMGLEKNTENMLTTQKQLPIHLVIWEQSNDVEKVLKLKLPRIGGCGEMQADGELGSCTAALFEPCLNRDCGCDTLIYSQEYWDELVLKAHQNHLQFAAHAEAEAGIEAVLVAIEKAQIEYPRSDARHRIEHLELPTMDQLDRMAKNGVIASVQPAFLDMSPEEIKDTYEMYGKVRMERFNPLRSIYERGVVLVGGSDSPVTPYDPILGIHCAVNHPLPQERLSVKEAIKMFTINAAYSAFEEKEKGTLEEGKIADMVVVSCDPYDVAIENIYEKIKVEYIFVAGKAYNRVKI